MGGSAPFVLSNFGRFRRWNSDLRTHVSEQLTINALNRNPRLLQHHRFLDYTRVNGEGKGRDRGQFSQLPFEARGRFKKLIGLLAIEKHMHCLPVCFGQQRMIRLVLLEDAK